jgi:hypothetical protein
MCGALYSAFALSPIQPYHRFDDNGNHHRTGDRHINLDGGAEKIA